MLELYQFELSQFSEKVRFILDYKGLEYRKIEVVPGVGQIELFRLSGQRQVPVLKDGETFIPDSTEIALYLERKYPEKPLLPENPLLKGQCLLMEEWADTSIGLQGRTAFIGAINQNQNLRRALLPRETPDFLKNLLGAVPSELLDLLGTGVGFGKQAVKDAQRGLKQDLEALCLILSDRPYLLGEQPTLADFSVAALSMLLKFPPAGYIAGTDNFAGQGIPGLADNSFYQVFWDWRDRLYAQYRKPLSSQSSPGSNPTTINID